MKNSKRIRLLVFFTFALAAVCIVVLLKSPERIFRTEEAGERPQQRFLFPQAGPEDGAGEDPERFAREDALRARVPLEEGEVVAAILALDVDGDLRDEQFFVSRTVSAPGMDGPMRVVMVGPDPDTGEYRRSWSAPAAATRPGTVSLYAQDVVGDRGACVVVTGMNGAGQHTLTIFRRDGLAGPGEPWKVIADIRIDGAIVIREVERSQAYRMGQAPGQSFAIAAYGRDPDSENILDQVEVLYRYDERYGRYEQERRTRVPGSQVEQRRVRELLSGRAPQFEAFISGLWYYVSPQGTVDSRQYIYFDPANRELIFYVADTQQVFYWAASSVTRYGLYISSHNVSVRSLRRSIDIELESLSSIRVRVYEDVRLPIGINDSWDGSYRMADPREREGGGREGQEPWVDAVWDGSIGNLTLDGGGTWELAGGGAVRGGTYAFFRLEGRTLLELRPGLLPGNPRDTWLAEYPSAGSLVLTRVALGTRGMRIAPETAITLTAPDAEEEKVIE